MTRNSINDWEHCLWLGTVSMTGNIIYNLEPHAMTGTITYDWEQYPWLGTLSLTGNLMPWLEPLSMTGSLMPWLIFMQYCNWDTLPLTDHIHMRLWLTPHLAMSHSHDLDLHARIMDIMLWTGHTTSLPKTSYDCDGLTLTRKTVNCSSTQFPDLWTSLRDWDHHTKYDNTITCLLY